MTGPPKDIIVAKHASPLCHGDSALQINGTKLFHHSALQKGPQNMSLSEYQSAYQRCPWQPVRQCLKPRDESTQNIKSGDKVHTEMFRKSTYGQDYVTYAVARKPPKPKKKKTSLQMPDGSFDASTTYKVEYYSKSVQKPKPVNTQQHDGMRIPASEGIEFQGETIYQVSYPEYDVDTINRCHESPIKAKENVVIPQSRGAAKNPRSTAQHDFVHHENVQRPTLIYPKENTEIPTDPMNSRTEYKDFYTNKSQAQIKNIMIKVKTDDTKMPDGAPISTAMTDYTDPKSTQPPKLIRQASTNFTAGAFDGRTISNMAYKEWPVQPYDLPIWAKKPEYKRSKGGMLVNSLYAHDYTDPKMISEQDFIRRNPVRDHVIISGAEGDMKFKPMTTYKRDFQTCKGAMAPRSLQVTEKYKPPKEKMMCETNHRSHFTGMPSPKMKLCRQPSQHRELNTNKRMTFLTTYKETYLDPRPKSSPICNSTPEVVPRIPGSAKVRGSDTPPLFKIPHVDLKSIPQCNVNKLKIAAATSTPPNTPVKERTSDEVSEATKSSVSEATKSATPNTTNYTAECDGCKNIKSTCSCNS